MKFPEVFLKATSEFIAKLFDTDEKNVIIEFQSNVVIMRQGSCDKALNVDLHHNSDIIDNDTKIEIAEKIAKFIHEKLNIPQDRTLVLFYDTRKCS